MILETTTKTVDSVLRLEDHPGGYRIIWHDDKVLCMDSSEDLARCATWVLRIRRHRPRPKTIAHIGGGFCLTAHLLGPELDHTIYEIEPKLEQFAPQWAQFVAGDWTSTISGFFDVIVYDIGGVPPIDLLSAHRAPGGLILGVD